MRLLTLRTLAALVVGTVIAIAPSTASVARPASDQVSGLMAPDDPNAPACLATENGATRPPSTG